MSDFSSGSERRRFPRVRFDQSVTVHQVVESKSGNVFEVQGNPVTVKAQNVSEGGIGLELADTDAPTKILKLQFQLQKNKPVDVYTKLAWKNKKSCGVQFIVLDEDQRRLIRDYVDKKGGI